MEACYPLLDVSGVRRTGSCSAIRLHPNTYDLIASDALSIWVGDRALIDLFANEPQQNAQ